MRQYKALLVWVSLACVFSAPVAANTPRYNLVLVAVDALRADHLPFYGYSRQTAPHLTARSASAVIFERAIAQASWTLPSFVSLFTSLYPQEHRVNNQFVSMAEKERNLTEILLANGSNTAGFVGGPYIDPVYGFQRGFKLFRGCGAGNYRFFSETAAQAADWIRSQKGGRFFVFVHGNDLHPPFNLTHEGEKIRHVFDDQYAGPVDAMLIDYRFVSLFNMQNSSRVPSFIHDLKADPDYLAQLDTIRTSPRDLEHIVAHYDGRIHEADKALEQVFDALRQTGHDKDTIVILLSDHGLELGEKGALGTGWHASQLETIIHVPLVIWHPTLRPRRVKEPVELVDVAPTALQMLGLPPEPAFRGRSLVGLAAGLPSSENPRYAFSMSSITDVRDIFPRLHSVQDGRWKMIYNPETGLWSLFDLHLDSTETKDIFASNPSVVKRLKNALSRHLIH